MWNANAQLITNNTRYFDWSKHLFYAVIERLLILRMVKLVDGGWRNFTQ